MLTPIVHLQTLKWALPTCVMMGSAPLFLSLWAALRILSIPCKKQKYYALDDGLYSIYQRMVLFFFEHYTDAKVFLYDCDGDETAIDHEGENAIYISNHQSNADWVVADMVAMRHHMLGQMRFMLKDGLRYLPLYGFYFYQHSCVFVGRHGKFSEDRTAHKLAALRDAKVPMYFVIFPEGTRYDVSLHDQIQQSQAYCEERGVEKLQHVLAPRARGLLLSLRHLGPHVTYVYDVTVAYSASRGAGGERVPTPGLPELLGSSRPELHVSVSRVPAAAIPTDPAAFESWLLGRYVRKDRLLKTFYETGSFPGHERRTLSRLPVTSCLVPTLVLGGATAAILATPGGRRSYACLSLVWLVGGTLYMACLGR